MYVLLVARKRRFCAAECFADREAVRNGTRDNGEKVGGRTLYPLFPGTYQYIRAPFRIKGKVREGAFASESRRT